MATAYTREWIQFFTGCGIPDDVAAIYALIFYENRIQKNMLLDLNKEYLRDMGITVMGDVIAILRHAKIIHEKYIRAQILSVEDNLLIEQSNPINESSPAIKKSTPMKRMLGHYTRKCNSQELEPVSEVQVTLPNDKVTTAPEETGEKSRMQRPLKKKIQISGKDKNTKEKDLEVPVPKVRRVLPENEGRYKIKMPSGTTERSKKLLEMVNSNQPLKTPVYDKIGETFDSNYRIRRPQRARRTTQEIQTTIHHQNAVKASYLGAASKKRKAKTVFDRLGESSVSSTTSEISPSSISSSLLIREKNPSVFSRLGEKTSVVSSTSSVDDSEIVSPDQLPYAGILKGASVKKNLPSTTMRADEQQQSEVNKVKMKVSVKKRLGVTKPEEGAQQNMPMIKAVRLKDLTELKSARFKVSTKTNPQLETKFSSRAITTKNFKADNPPGATTQAQETKILLLKRNFDGTSDASPQKKVRFGKTTHRLIPATPSSTDPVSYVKNYPKLTMIIKNKTNASESNTLSSGIKIGSLNSDNLNDRLGVKARIGNVSVQGRLGKRLGTFNPGVSCNGKKSTVKDRLG